MKQMMSEIFEKWFKKLPLNIQGKVMIYINRVLEGNFSNCKSVDSGVSEIKIDYQKGCRVYFIILKNRTILFLLVGGDKKSQKKDIKLAIEMKEFFKVKGEI
jgi:putative addiction module killer protein